MQDNGSQEIPKSLRDALSICQYIDPRKVNEKELKEYYHFKGKIGGIRLKCKLMRSYILQKLAMDPPIHELSVIFQRIRGVSIGQNVYIGPYVHLDFLYPHMIMVEDFVSIGMNSMIFAHSNPTCSVWLKVNCYPRKIAPVKIKCGAWIAPGCIILPGVTIGEHSVVGAGSVVLDDVEPFTLVAGVPARFIKRLNK